jgi:hypothetical protein
MELSRLLELRGNMGWERWSVSASPYRSQPGENRDALG